jgi:hypothetical protein
MSAPASTPPGHTARPIEGAFGKWGWDCAQCGTWSHGFRCKSEASAAEAARRHNERAYAEDQRWHRRLYGPVGRRGDG